MQLSRTHAPTWQYVMIISAVLLGMAGFTLAQTGVARWVPITLSNAALALVLTLWILTDRR
jgi:hypothetical protein